VLESMAAAEQGTPQVFAPLSADEDDMQHPTVVESMCMNCHEDGTTKLLLVLIPFFREVVVASFECPHCAYRNSELQLAAEIQEHGVHIELHVTKVEDVSRQVVKSERATVTIPEIEFEIPAGVSNLSTVEGFLTEAADNLEKDQPVRVAMDPDTAAKVEAIIQRLRGLAAFSEPFTLIVDDCSGNSFIEHHAAPGQDPAIKFKKYRRSQQQDVDLGLAGEGQQGMLDKGREGVIASQFSHGFLSKFTDEEKEVYQLPGQCGECQREGANHAYLCGVMHAHQRPTLDRHPAFQGSHHLVVCV